MRIIGIAGESGTGKSTIAAHLATRERGVHIDGDRVAHEVLETDADVRAEIRQRFGARMFDPAGRVDRGQLGARAFSSPRTLAALNSIMHPAIRRRCGELVQAAREAGAPLVVVDAALLLDTSMPFVFDLMIALRCDPGVQMQRIMAKGGWTESHVRARLKNQSHIENSFYKADAVVDTSGELEAVLAEVERIVGETATGDDES